MRKIICAAAFIVAASIPAWGNEAAEFLLKTCLPAMDDLANVDVMARTNNWSRLPPIESTINATSRSQWRTNGFIVITRSYGDLPSCHLTIYPYKRIYRDEFFAAIAGALELKPSSETSYRESFRQDLWEIIGSKQLNLLITSNNDIVSIATIYMGPSEGTP